jgi:hypothetical protein
VFDSSSRLIHVFSVRKVHDYIRNTRSRIQSWRNCFWLGNTKIWTSIPKKENVGETGQQGQIFTINLVSISSLSPNLLHWWGMILNEGPTLAATKVS